MLSKLRRRSKLQGSRRSAGGGEEGWKQAAEEHIQRGEEKAMGKMGGRDPRSEERS